MHASTAPARFALARRRALAAIAPLALLAGCGDGDAAANAAPTSQPGAAEPVTIRLGDVTRGEVDETVEVVGTLYGEQEASIAAKSTGRIVRIDADLGDRLDQGRPLAQVDPTDYQLAVTRAELALNEALAALGLERLPEDDFDVERVPTVRRADVQAKNAGARLERSKQLYEQRPPLISEQDFADTQTQYDVARQDYDVAKLEARASLAAAQSRAAELAEARQRLADTTLRAPGDPGQGPAGRWAVAERRVSIGEFVQPGSVAFRVISDQPILLRAAVPERFLMRVKQGQPVALRVDSLEQPVRGTLSRVSPAVDVTSRTFNIEVTFPNEDRRLSPGSFGRATITTGRRGGVLTIPAAGLYSFAGLEKIFTVKDGKAVAHNVRVIERLSENRVVVPDVIGEAGQIVVEGLARLATGVPVTVSDEATTRAAARGQ